MSNASQSSGCGQCAQPTGTDPGPWPPGPLRRDFPDGAGASGGNHFGGVTQG